MLMYEGNLRGKKLESNLISDEENRDFPKPDRLKEHL